MRLNSLTAVNAWRALLGAGGSSGSGALSFTSLSVDPQNVSGNASDLNPGTPGLPIETTARANQLLVGRLTADSLVHYLSDDTSGDGLDLSHLSLGVFNLTVTGTAQVLHTGGTINAGTIAINPVAAGGGQRQTAHTSDLATFAPFVFTGLGGASANPTRLIVTATGADAWVVSGVATASMSQPVDTTALAAGALTIGAAYQIVRGSLLTLASADSPATTTGVVTFNGFTFTATSVGPTGPEGGNPTGLANVIYVHCAFLGSMAVSGLYRDCFLTAGGVGNFQATLSAGVYLSVDLMTGIIVFQDAVYCTGNMIVGGGFLNSAFFEPGSISNSSIQFQDDTVNIAPLIIAESAQTTATGLIWGNGNTGVGVAVAAGADFVVQPAVVPSVTGTGGDFGFQDVSGTHVLARAWDDVAGTYTANRSTTWANLVAAIGAGGFGGNAHYLTADAHLVTVTL